MKDNSATDYDSVSRNYDVSRGANIETKEKLIRLLHVDCNSVLLDMGSGTGNYAAALQKAAKNVSGIDISIGMIEQARTKFPELQFIHGDVVSLPFDSESFDGVFSTQVLHHVKKKEVFLGEAYRVLRENRYIAINSSSHKQLQAFWFWHYFPRGLEAELARTPDSGDIALLLERARFSNIATEICYRDLVVVDDMPKRFLEKNYRDGISTFALLTEDEIKLGCERLQEDIISGVIENIVREAKTKQTNVGGSFIIYGEKC